MQFKAVLINEAFDVLLIYIFLYIIKYIFLINNPSNKVF